MQDNGLSRVIKDIISYPTCRLTSYRATVSMAAGKRHKTLKAERKDFMTHSRASRMSFMFAFVPLVP